MIRLTLSLSVVVFVAASAHAQRPEDGQGRRGGPPPGFRGGPPGFHMMEALDADKDGKISADEIDNAVAALQKLDKDKDGKLSGQEIGWPPSRGPNFFGRMFGGGGNRGGPGGGGFPGFGGGGGFPGFGGEGGSRPRRPDPDNEEDFRASDDPQSPDKSRRTFFSAAQLKRLDRNEDGKIDKSEIPKRMQAFVLGKADANKDGFIDADELAKLDEPKDDAKE